MVFVEVGVGEKVIVFVTVLVEVEVLVNVKVEVRSDEVGVVDGVAVGAAGVGPDELLLELQAPKRPAVAVRMEMNNQIFL